MSVGGWDRAILKWAECTEAFANPITKGMLGQMESACTSREQTSQNNSGSAQLLYEVS